MNNFMNEGTDTQSHFNWINISNGDFVMKSDENEPKAKSRVNKLGNTVFERHFQSIGPVYIKSLTMYESKYGDKNIYVGVQGVNQDKVDTVIIIKSDSGYGRSFFDQVFNIEFDRLVVIKPWSKLYEDKKVTKLYITYTNNDKALVGLPNGTPELIFHDIKGKKVIDNISQIKRGDYIEEAFIKMSKDKGMWIEKKEEGLYKEATIEEKKELSKELNKLKKNKSDREPDIDDLFN